MKKKPLRRGNLTRLDADMKIMPTHADNYFPVTDFHGTVDGQNIQTTEQDAVDARNFSIENKQ